MLVHLLLHRHAGAAGSLMGMGHDCHGMHTAQGYVTAKIKQFAAAFCRRVALNVTPAQLDTIVAATLSGLAAQEINTSRALRLVVRHDCQ